MIARVVSAMLLSAFCSLSPMLYAQAPAKMLLTGTPVLSQNQAVNTSAATVTGVPVLGGRVFREAGGVTFRIFSTGTKQDVIFHLQRVGSQIAIQRMADSLVCSLTTKCLFFSGDLLFTRESVSYHRYIQRTLDDTSLWSVSASSLPIAEGLPNQVRTQKDWDVFTSGPGKAIAIYLNLDADSDSCATAKERMGNPLCYNSAKRPKEVKGAPKLVNDFYRSLLTNFDETTKQILTAAAIPNTVEGTLSLPEFREPLPTEVEDLTQNRNTEVRQRIASGEIKSGNLGTILSSMASGYTTIHQATSGLLNTAVGVSSGNSNQLSQGLNDLAAASGNQTLNANTVNGNVATPTGGASGSGQYTGPNAQWVHKMLGTVGTYTCSPTGAPKVNKNFSCQRDGYIAQAQLLAWAAECSEQTGNPDDAIKDANVMMQTLQTAKSLCGGATFAGAKPCDSDRIISCGQLP